ncbi:Aste57867_13301 [Aphanomyces stellatus]|uniref:Aste57867_13301 protein n=1 Tax=Aphanomyces stellatus TaxID=120398 RepID=A0A485KY96_9STRA|nr:hypothetical protein As57867_013252 [Aphanomyces stellatus]VFT90140.1 Aste57867_13301 [Aphanomyces stellatus]
MGISGWGLTGMLTMLVAVGFGFVTLITPLWYTNAGISAQHAAIVTRAETNVGLIGMCFDVEFKDDTDRKFAVKDCYPYFGGNGGSYRYIGHTSKPSFQEHKSDEGICTYYNSNQVNNKAAKEISIMTGMAWMDVDFFLESTCGKTGKASIAMSVLFLTLTFITFVSLVVVVFCCKSHVWLVTFARVCATLAAIFSVVLTFTVMSQVKGIKSATDGADVKYGFCFYMEYVGLAFLLIAAWAIEKHALSQKTQKVDLI